MLTSFGGEMEGNASKLFVAGDVSFGKSVRAKVCESFSVQYPPQRDRVGKSAQRHENKKLQ